jgi:CRISPR-associated protein Csb1
LVPKKDGAIVLEAVRSDGSTTSIDLDLSGAISLYNEAVRNLPQELRFEKGPGASIAELTPSPKLVDLIKRSRELAAAGAEVGDE